LVKCLTWYFRYVIHNKLKEYTTQVGDRQVNYNLGGQDAVNRVDAGPNAMTTDGRGNRLITVKTHSVEGARPLELLKRCGTDRESLLY